MTYAKRIFSLMFVLAAAVVWELAATAPALAQERERGESGQRSERWQRAREGRGGQPGRERRPGLPHGRLPGASLFRPSPEDEGPLTVAEQEELLEFARQNVPDIERRLRQLREKSPQAFERRMQQAAPRLRQLRRIFERDAELGRNVVRHSENVHRIHRSRRAWIDSEDDPEGRRRIEELVRRWLAENLQIETAVLEDRAKQLEEQRAARIDAELKRLTSVGTDLAAEPEAIRESVEAWHAAESDEQRTSLDETLRGLCSKRMDHELARLNERVEQMRENAVEEVDRRLEEFVSETERGPRWDPDARGEGRRGGGPKGEKDPKHGRRPERQP